MYICTRLSWLETFFLNLHIENLIIKCPLPPPPLFGKDVRNGSEHKDINSENEVIGIRYLQPDPLPPHASGFSLFANLDFELFLIY